MSDEDLKEAIDAAHRLSSDMLKLCACDDEGYLVDEEVSLTALAWCAAVIINNGDFAMEEMFLTELESTLAWMRKFRPRHDRDVSSREDRTGDE